MADEVQTNHQEVHTVIHHRLFVVLVDIDEEHVQLDDDLEGDAGSRDQGVL